MIKHPELLREFEDNFIRNQKLPFSISVKIFEAMWQEGVILSVLPPKEPLEGIDVDIKIAKILNSCLKKSLQE